jgi:CRISPR-associated protein Cas2
MLYLICYDINRDALRAAFARRIIAAGLDRINKSVYLGVLTKPALQGLEAELHKLLLAKAEPQDSLIFLPVTPQQVQDMRIYGENGLDKDELSGQKSTLLV